MSKLDFQNGFALGLASKGQASSNMEVLDHTVQFIVEGETYELVRVNDGNAVRAPATNPVKDGFNFGGWEDGDGNVMTFPFIPTDDTTIVAINWSLSDLLWNSYNIDPDAYPFIFISVTQPSQMDYYDSYVYFLPLYQLTEDGFSTNDYLRFYQKLYHSNVTEDTIRDAETLIKLLCTYEHNDPTEIASSEHLLNTYDDGEYYYANFDGLSSWRDGYRFY